LSVENGDMKMSKMGLLVVGFPVILVIGLAIIGKLVEG